MKKYIESFFDDNDKIKKNKVMKEYLRDRYFLRINIPNDNIPKAIYITDDFQIKAIKKKDIIDYLNNNFFPYIKDDIIKVNSYMDFIDIINNQDDKYIGYGLDNSGTVFILYYHKMNLKHKLYFADDVFDNKEITNNYIYRIFLPDICNIYKLKVEVAYRWSEQNYFVQIDEKFNVKRIELKTIKEVLINTMNEYKYKLSNEAITKWKNFIDNMTNKKAMQNLPRLGRLNINIIQGDGNNISSKIINNFNQINFMDLEIIK